MSIHDMILTNPGKKNFLVSLPIVTVLLYVHNSLKVILSMLIEYIVV